MGDGGRAERGGIGNCTLAVGIVKVMNEITSRTCGIRIRPKRKREKSRVSALTPCKKRQTVKVSVSAESERQKDPQCGQTSAQPHTYDTMPDSHKRAIPHTAHTAAAPEQFVCGCQSVQAAR